MTVASRSYPSRPILGVGAIVIPWNSPLMLATWNLGPCLAAGNACVLKPSELAPLTSIALGEIAAEAGLPPGVLNIVTGLGETVGEAAKRSSDACELITFQGKTYRRDIGWREIREGRAGAARG